MRIALVCTDRNVVYADPRRCPSRLRGLTETLVRAGHEVTLLLAAPQLAVEGIALREMRLPVTTREIDWHFSQIQPELVIERLVPGRTECALAARDCGVRLMLDVDGCLLVADSTGVASVLTEAATRPSMAAVIAASDEDALALREMCGQLLPVDVVEDAVAPELFQSPNERVMAQVCARLHLYLREARVGFLGPLTRESGVFELVRAAAELHDQRVPRLMLLSDGPARNDVLRLADELGVKLTLCGRVSDDELPAHLSACDYVVASATGGALPMLQAMAAARAVIAFDSAAARRVARDGVEARLVATGAPVALLAALREISGDAALRARLGAAARKRVSKSFTWDAQCARVLEFAGAMGEKSRAV